MLKLVNYFPALCILLLGMNFYDFFILITRFVLANMIQLYHLKKKEDAVSNSSNKAHHFIGNLVSIRAVASKMKSFGAFAGENLNSCSIENRSAFSDVKKILEEKDFHELCVALVKAYETTDERWGQNFEIGKAPPCPEDSLLLNCSRADRGVPNFVTASLSQICGPEDLIILIEHAIINSRSTSGNFDLMSELCDGPSNEVS